jgi:C4-dicarboxylate-specific signal transduction histidine kinase
MQHIPVLFVVFACLSLLTAGLLAWIWALSGRPAYLASWAGACLSIGTARLILAAAPSLPPMFVFALGNALLISSTVLLWAGARQLRGTPPAAWLVAAPGLVWLAAGFWPGFYASDAWRVAVSSIVIATASIAFAHAMFTLPRSGMQRVLARMIALLALLYAMAYLLRLVLPSMVGYIAVNLPMVIIGGTLFLAISFLALTLGQLDNIERETLLQESARVEEVRLLAEAALREADALRAGRAEIERLHRALPIMLFHGYLKPDGSVGRIYRNGDLEATFGWPAEDLAPLETFEAFSDYGETTLPALYAGVLRDGEGSWEWRLRRPDGSWTSLRTQARRVENPVQPGGEVVAYVFNIDRERDAEARAQAAGRLAVLGDMAAGLAQDLRQPLRSLLAGAEAARAMALPLGDPKLDARLERIVAQAAWTIEIVEHLDRFARGDEESAPAQVIALNSAVRSALVMTGDALRSAGIVVETELPEPGPRIMGHLVAVEQVLTNLIMNARDALAGLPQGATRRLRIATGADAQGKAHVIIADTGGGISASVMGRLFEPFVTTKGAEAGTGLGLSICHGLVRGMNGTIEADNDPEGAVFTVTLPALAA